MNRKERRLEEKRLRKTGLDKNMAKQYVDFYYRGPLLKEGDKVKLNYPLIERHPLFKVQEDEFREWVEAHKDYVLTVDKVYVNGKEVTFVEDDNEPKFIHKSETLIPLPTATIKLDDGSENKTIVFDPATLEEKGLEHIVNTSVETLNNTAEE